jgi:glycolate oxidase iron-sulfur subunit
MTECYLDAEALQKIDACVHCGLCLTACPTYRVTGNEAESPRGRLYLMRALAEESPGVSAQAIQPHIDSCLGCLACQTACPSGVDYETLLSQTRMALLEQQPAWLRVQRRLWLEYILPRQIWLTVLATVLQQFQRIGGPRVLKRLFQNPFIQKVLGPSLQAKVGFIPHIQEIAPLAQEAVYGENIRGRVALMTGCVMNTLFARVHRATIHVLVENGYQVVIPKQTCCGALAHHAGEHDITEKLATQNITSVLQSNPDWIISNAAGCGSTLQHYASICPTNENAKRFAEKADDILAFLDRIELKPPYQSVIMKVAYHAACHLHHAQEVQQQPYSVLSQIPGLDFIPLTEADMCCGSAGVYNMAHSQMSLDILNMKMAHIHDLGPIDAILSANPGCTIQLESGLAQRNLAIPVMHPIEVLALAYTRGGIHPQGHSTHFP